MIISGASPDITFTQCTLIVLMLIVLMLPVSTHATTCDRAEGEAAIPFCRQALLASPQDVDLLVQYADILLDLGRPLEAVELLETSHGKAPGNNTIRLKLSNAKEAAAKPSEDRGPSSRAIDRLNVLQCKTRIGQAALNGCYSALEQQPLDVELLTAKGDALMEIKRPTEAVRTYELALAQDKNNNVIKSKLDLALSAASREQVSRTSAQVAKQNEPIEKEPVKKQPVEVAVEPVKIAMEPAVTAVAKEIRSVLQFSNASIDGQVSY